MKIDSLFRDKKVVYSFEIYPPRRGAPIETVYTALEQIQTMEPDYISVTYGAGGKGSTDLTAEIAHHITHNYNIPAIAHLTCLHSRREEVLEVLQKLAAKGIQNVLALRGDRVEGAPPAGDFHYASELAAFIRQQGDFCIGGACYPEGHIESASLCEDVQNLKKKVDAGVSYLTTQLFFDNDDYYRFLERCQKAGIHLPVTAGILPPTSKKQVERMVSLNGSKIPQKLARIIQKYEDDPASLREAGTHYAIEQILDLVENDAHGIHLYIMNKPDLAEAVTSAVRPAIQAKNDESQAVAAC